MDGRIKMGLKHFLNKYDTVIFDMDGVITSEQNYWNCAALTVWEYMHRNRGIDIDAAQCMEQLSEIRKKVFCDDKIITELKARGVNSNWDLGYVTVCIAWICGAEDDFSKVLEYVKTLPPNIIDEYDNIARKCAEKTGYDFDWLRRNGLMWQTMTIIFQEWFLGDDLYFKVYNALPQNSGKSGLLFKEEPIVPKKKLIELMRILGEEKRIGTGTGRPYSEMLRPLSDWGIKQYFADDALINYNHVAAAEEKFKPENLTKPHPYMFLKSMLGENFSDERIVSGDYDKAKTKTTLIVGDAGADMLAAQAMGADFCAVLTGINGQAARPYFEEHNATYIFDSVIDFLE